MQREEEIVFPNTSNPVKPGYCLVPTRSEYRVLLQTHVSEDMFRFLSLSKNISIHIHIEVGLKAHLNVGHAHVLGAVKS